MGKIEKVLLTGKSSTTSGSGDNVTIKMTATGAREHLLETIPRHPAAEQLIAGAWAACFSGAVEVAAKEKKVKVPDGTVVEIEVDLGQTGKEYFVQGRINLIMPGIAQELATEIAQAADRICPYSKATHGNIDVALNVTT